GDYAEILAGVIADARLVDDLVDLQKGVVLATAREAADHPYRVERVRLEDLAPAVQVRLQPAPGLVRALEHDRHLLERERVDLGDVVVAERLEALGLLDTLLHRRRFRAHLVHPGAQLALVVRAAGQRERGGHRHQALHFAAPFLALLADFAVAAWRRCSAISSASR